eukprot:11172438-Lingulodinium_polyedra.AAC.1
MRASRAPLAVRRGRARASGGPRRAVFRQPRCAARATPGSRALQPRLWDFSARRHRRIVGRV